MIDIKRIDSIDSPDELRALIRSGIALAGEKTLAEVLQTICDTARDVVQAKYAALGVVEDGVITEFITSGTKRGEREKIGNLPDGRELLRVLAEEPHSMKLDDLSKNERSRGVPSNHPKMKSFMGIPIEVGSKISGRLYLTDKIGGGEFSDGDETVASVLATQAGIAISNIQYHELEKDQLKSRAELKEAHTRDRLRQELVTRVIEAQEDERRRISRELHDEAGQALTSVMLGLRLVIESGESKAVKDQIEMVRSQVSDALTRLRRLAAEMRPTALEDFGLVPALKRLIDDPVLNEAFSVDFAAPDLKGQLSLEAEAVLYRVLQEALTNVKRHSEANNLSITITERGNFVIAIVEDDGKGFIPEKIDGLGLLGMRERIDLINGEIKIESAPDRGTSVVCEVPVKKG